MLNCSIQIVTFDKFRPTVIDDSVDDHDEFFNQQ